MQTDYLQFIFKAIHDLLTENLNALAAAQLE